MMNRAHSRRWLLWASALLVASLGCLPDDLGGGANVSGEIFGTSFSGSTGVADVFGGRYIITISDSLSYTCTSTPSTDYMTLVLGEFSQPGRYQAAGLVSFNSVEQGANFSEPATSGTLTIDEIDLEQGVIRGSVEARGPNSDASGSFDVTICN